jgi:hypothetical protein
MTERPAHDDFRRAPKQACQIHYCDRLPAERLDFAHYGASDASHAAALR